MAQWIFENFPAECQEKKANSTFIKSDADLVQQIVAEISSQRPALQKRNPQVKTTEGRPRQYYWTENPIRLRLPKLRMGVLMHTHSPAEHH